MNRRSVGRRSVRRILLPLAAVLVSTTFTWAADQGRLERTFDTTREPRVSLTNIKGTILVRGWDKAQVHIVYLVASPHVDVDSDVLPDRLHFETHLLDPALPASERVVDYTLDVPAASSLEIRNPQGKIIVDGIQADANMQSVSSDVTVRDCSGHLSIRSVAGDIEVIRSAGVVEAESITGNLHFVSPATTRLRGTTTSGRILYEGDFARHGEYILSAYSGDLDILCPVSASYDLRAKTLKGKVTNTMPMSHRREAASSLDARRSLLGTSDRAARATLELTSFSGNIHIRPQD